MCFLPSSESYRPITFQLFMHSLFENCRKCSVQLYPVYPFKIETFRENVEKYFNQRQDVIEKVIACKVENHGQNVRLEAIPKIRREWINFFNDPKGRYEDLQESGLWSMTVEICQTVMNILREFSTPSIYSGWFFLQTYCNF